ncbi:MAG: biosynthetic peptidoglycan transglycosylase, partial [Pseudomonadota bacterium]
MRDDRHEAGYYSVQDPYGSALDDFDEKFDWGQHDDGRDGKRKRSWLKWPTWRRKREPELEPAVFERPEYPPQEPPSKWRTRWKWISRGFAACLFVFILIVGWLALTAPLSKSLEPIAPPQVTLLASDGTPIARSGAVVDEPVEVEELPDHVVGAFLAIEDRRFYSHWGIDPRGIARAAWSNISGGPRQGGSTITQQLAKFTFLTPEQSMT